jgi:MFS family permease
MEQAHGIAAGQWARLLLVYAVGLSVLQYPVVRLTRRWDPLLLLAGASALIGLGLGLSPLLPWGWPSVALILLVGLGVVVLIPVASAIVAGFAPVALRGRYMGAWTIVYLGGCALGPLCGGYAIDLLGARRAFLVVAVAGLAGALGFALLRFDRGFRGLPGAPAPRREPPETSLEGSLKPPIVGS